MVAGTQATNRLRQSTYKFIITHRSYHRVWIGWLLGGIFTEKKVFTNRMKERMEESLART